jgi:hypothetical protein
MSAVGLSNSTQSASLYQYTSDPIRRTRTIPKLVVTAYNTTKAFLIASVVAVFFSLGHPVSLAALLISGTSLFFQHRKITRGYPGYETRFGFLKEQYTIQVWEKLPSLESGGFGLSPRPPLTLNINTDRKSYSEAARSSQGGIEALPSQSGLSAASLRNHSSDGKERRESSASDSSGISVPGGDDTTPSEATPVIVTPLSGPDSALLNSPLDPQSARGASVGDAPVNQSTAQSSQAYPASASAQGAPEADEPSVNLENKSVEAASAATRAPGGKRKKKG